MVAASSCGCCSRECCCSLLVARRTRGCHWDDVLRPRVRSPKTAKDKRPGQQSVVCGFAFYALGKKTVICATNFLEAERKKVRGSKSTRGTLFWFPIYGSFTISGTTGIRVGLLPIHCCRCTKFARCFGIEFIVSVADAYPSCRGLAGARLPEFIGGRMLELIWLIYVSVVAGVLLCVRCCFLLLEERQQHRIRQY